MSDQDQYKQVEINNAVVNLSSSLPGLIANNNSGKQVNGLIAPLSRIPIDKKQVQLYNKESNNAPPINIGNIMEVYKENDANKKQTENMRKELGVGQNRVEDGQFVLAQNPVQNRTFQAQGQGQGQGVLPGAQPFIQLMR